MKTVEHSIVVQASTKRLFSIYADVAQWPLWDPDTKAARIDGPFVAGTRGSLTPARGNTVPMMLTEVVPDRSFTAEVRIPLFRMVFEHELQPSGRSTRVVHRVSFSGALAFFLGRVIGARVDKGLPVTLTKLKSHAETR